jgi:hypothetical protein
VSLESTLREASCDRLAPLGFFVRVTDGDWTFQAPIAHGILEIARREQDGTLVCRQRGIDSEEVLELVELLVDICVWEAEASALGDGAAAASLLVQANGARGLLVESGSGPASRRIARVRDFFAARARRQTAPLAALSPASPLALIEENALTLWFDDYRGLDATWLDRTLLSKERVVTLCSGERAASFDAFAGASRWTYLELPVPIVHPECRALRERLPHEDRRAPIVASDARAVVTIFPLPSPELRTPEVLAAVEKLFRGIQRRQRLLERGAPEVIRAGEDQLVEANACRVYFAVCRGLAPLRAVTVRERAVS